MHTYGYKDLAGCLFRMFPQQGVYFAFMINLLNTGLHCEEMLRIHNVFTGVSVREPFAMNGLVVTRLGWFTVPR